MRQVVLDTETTGLDYNQGHRVIEIGVREIVNRRVTDRSFHVYINPEREVEAEALQVHGITNEFLSDKPLFSEVAKDFLEFVGADEMIIHNAPFDLGFLNFELTQCIPKFKALQKKCSVIDTLVMARQAHPGMRNSLDALCGRYGVDNSGRDLHGALLDADLLALLYLSMTSGQTALFDMGDGADAHYMGEANVERRSYNIPVLKANVDELALHEKYFE